jgi:CTP:molybdopterin cytidylyltransferase MocA
MTPQILILAAGTSSRMRGGDKLLELIDGKPLLLRVASAAVATGAEVKVTLPPDRPDRARALSGLPVCQIIVPEAATGMASSLKAGNVAIPADAPVLLLLADLPEITADDLSRMLSEWQLTPDLILRGTARNGTPGHPVCLPVWCRNELARLDGDEGARRILARHADKLRLVALPEAHATTDLDTPEDWDAWRRQRLT